MPLVSFLIPTYNRADFIVQTIDSIFSQDCQDFEIIVIDDGSLDNTEQLLKQKFNGNIIYHRNDSNQGVASSRNIALGYASGKYIGLLDSDDVLCERAYLRIALDVMEKNKEIGIFTCDAYCIDANGKKLHEKTFFQTTIDYKDVSLSSGIKDFEYVFLYGIHSCAALIRKEAVPKEGFLDPKYKIAWDDDFFLRFAAKSRYKIYYYNTPFAGYRIHAGSLSKKSGLYEEKIGSRRDILKNNKDLRLKLGSRLNKRLSSQYLCLIDAFIKEKRSFFLIITIIIKAIIIDPPVVYSFLKIGYSCFKKKFRLKQ